MATPTLTTDVPVTEAELDDQRSDIFSSLTRITHMNPLPAKILASAYRAALSFEAFVHKQAAASRTDTTRFWLTCSVGGLIAAVFAEHGFKFAAWVAGWAKYACVILAAGSGGRMLLKKRSGQEILEFLFGEGKGGGEEGIE